MEADQAPDALTTLRAIVDPLRLAVLGSSVGHPTSIDELAAELDVERRDVAKAIGSLRSDGLLDSDAKVDVDALRAVAESIPSSTEGDERIEGPWTDDEAVILGRFFRDGRLTSVPTNASKRSLVLEKLAQDFEPGRRYTEREVNFRIQMAYHDYAAIRRYMVDGGLMDRADGAYWRTGGRYAVPEIAGGALVDRREIIATEMADVVLRAYTWDMADELVAAADDERIPVYMGDMFATPYTLDDANEWIAAANAEDPVTQYAIFVDERLVGGAGGYPAKAENTGSVEIGWWIVPDMWGRGIGTAAVCAVVDEFFDRRGAMRVWAPVMHPNVASQRVAMNAGLFLEGTAPSAYLKGGVRYDQMTYGLTRSQWQANR